MSTSDKWTVDLCECPCGRGKILQHVDSPDNPWSRTTYEHELVCDHCSRTLILIGTELRDKAAYQEARDNCNKFYNTEKELESLCRQAIDHIVASKAFADYKSEHRVLVAAGICKEGPIRYPRARSNNSSAGALCSPLGNIPWICRELRDREMASRIGRLHEDAKRFKAAYNAAQKRESPTAISTLKK